MPLNGEPAAPKHGDNFALVIRVQYEHRAVKHRFLNPAIPLLNQLWDKVQHQLLWEVMKVAVTIKGFMVQLLGVWRWIFFGIQIRESAFVQCGRALAKITPYYGRAERYILQSLGSLHKHEPAIWRLAVY